ncbi:MAG: hypothetical protein Q8J72_10215 [Rhodocyclaceae bacterium]|nr:hypothetical protein [Rhodocyclaceae bacterium]
MKTAEAIQADIKKLQAQLERVQARVREARVARMLSALDSTGLSDDEAVAALEAAAKTKAEAGSDE